MDSSTNLFINEEYLQKASLQAGPTPADLLKEAEAEVKRLKEENEKNLKSVEQQKKNAEQLEHQIKELEEKLSARDSELIQARKQAELLEKKMETLASANEQLDKQSRDAESAAMKKDSEIVELQSKHFSELTKKIEELSNYEAKVDLLTKEREQFKQRCDELTEEVKLLHEKEIQTIGRSEEASKIAEQEEQIGKLKEELAQLKKEQDALRTEKLQADMKKAAYDKDLYRKEDELKTERKHRSKLEQALGEKENEIAEKDKLIETLRQTAPPAPVAVPQVDETKIKQLQAQLEGIEKKHEEELREKTKSVEELKAELQKVRQEALERKSTRQCLDEDNYAITLTENENLKKRLKTLEYKLSEKTLENSQIEKIQKSLDSKNREMESLRDELKKAKEDFDNKLHKVQTDRDLRTSEEFKKMERKYIEYVKKIGDVLNLVQGMKMNKEQQDQIIQMLV